MARSSTSHVLMLAAALGTLAPATALADSQVRYTNRSGQVLHLYFAVAPYGTDIGCQDLIYGGTMEPDSSWQHFVPSNYWTWVRFLEDPSEAGCTSDTRDEWRYRGDGYGYQAQNVW